MNNLLNYILESNLYLVCFYLLYQILLVRDKHFRFNRAFLLGGIFLSLALPVLSVDISSQSTVEGYIMLPVITITEVQTDSVDFILKWWHIIGIVYISGAAFYLVKLVWQMARILGKLPLLNNSRAKKNGYTLVTTNGEIPTCSFFKYLFWDKSVNLTSEEQKQIFEHELAHIKQWHSLDVLVVELLRAVFWFNPIIHLVKSRITEVHEYLADHQATRQIAVEDYSKLLTLQIFRSFDFALSNNFHKSQILKRIRMLRATQRKSIWLNIALLIPVLALLITVLSCNVTDTEEVTESLETLNSAIAEINPNEIFTKVENQPEPDGGMTEFYHYIQNNLVYPIQAKQAGIEGVVFIQFIVAPDGTLTKVQAVKGIGGGCDEEAVRVIANSPKWQPGTQKDKAVNVRMIMPITFKLD